MPLTHTRNFRVRYYECDAFGHLNNANYLRYMQETAFDASAAAGYGLDRYAQMGCHWLIRETDIEFLRPVWYGETVEIKTWVMDFFRVRSRRAYESYLAGTDAPVAKALTDWVFVDTKTNLPVTIPQTFAQAFYPEGLPSKFPSREATPESPGPPAGVFRMQRQVTWQDIDNAHHVNNANYLNYVEECGMQVIAAYGWPIQRMLAEGVAILIRRHQIQYLRPAVLDDELVISTWVSDVRRSTAVRHYTIHRVRDNALLTRVHSLGVWVDLASQRPVRIPEQMLADFAPNIAD
ncbi:MAG TPA: thioesterase family protein [Anaerolineales bacterium]|nr:thioesterase family protein [Anaerolineales bacterium]